ncbi:MAG: efflux RND transporter periplasmic adaptor subunit [Planctomycetes bacterium]|nr:efflux RND transporter periplasmic adaptor subunit [Planctomycetota bacterium]
MPRIPLARLRRPLAVATGLLAMGLLLAWLLGAFHRRVPPGPPAAPPGAAAHGERHVVTAVRTPRTETAVGTVRAIAETIVASRILGRVRRLGITRAGQPVQQGEVLVELDADDLQAAAEQARAVLRAAATRRDKAHIDFARSEQLVQQGIAPPDRLDTDRAALAAAEAEVERARQAVAGAETALGFATLRAPIPGIVVDKLVQEGDVVQPGQPIASLYDPTRLQLVAVVREELAGRLQVGQAVDVTLDALGERCAGTVSEVVPAAAAQSRAFEVKVTGPCHPGVVTGMFGRLHVPLDAVDELRVPARAVQAIGQLDFVQVLAGDRAARRYVRLGQQRGDEFEVLSGLAAGEVVLVPAMPR